MNKHEKRHARRSIQSRQLGVPIVVAPPAPGASSSQAVISPAATSAQQPPAAATSARTPDPAVQSSTDPSTPSSRAIPGQSSSSAIIIPASTSSVLVTSAAVPTTVPIATVTVPAKTSQIPLPTTATSLVSGGSQAFSSGGLTLSRLSSSTASTSASSTNTAAPGSNLSSTTSITTGAIIGIVAGALIGVVLLATLIGFCIRRNAKAKDADDHVFDKDDFRRESILLDDGMDGNQMSEYAPGGLSRARSDGDLMPEYGNAALNRGNTYLPEAARGGLSTNHYGNQPSQQSFQPGQIFQHPAAPSAAAFSGAGAYGQGNPGIELYGGYPTSIGQQNSLDRGIFPPSQQQRQSPPQQAFGAHQQQSFGQQQPLYPLRSPSANSNSTVRPPPPAADELPRVVEERSGTPTLRNVQQIFHSHGDSVASQVSAGDMNRPFGSAGQTQSRGQSPTIERLSPPTQMLPGGEAFTIESGQRAQRTLSVRNGGGRDRADSAESDDDGYGGYA